MAEIVNLNIENIVNDLNNKLDKDLSNLASIITANMKQIVDAYLDQTFTIIYPNGGDKDNPANVTKNTRFILANPFPGYVVRCITEVLYNNQWGEINFTFYNTDTYGAKAMQLNDDAIILQTAETYIAGYASAKQGDPFGITTSTTINTLPCRIKVWKIGKILT